MTIKLTKAAALAPLKAAQGRSAAGRRPARRLRWIVGPAAALVVLAAGAIPAVAAGTSTPVVYYACVTNATGAIKIVHASTACATGQHKISWNNRGPAGPRGPQGPPGVTTAYAVFTPGRVKMFPADSMNIYGTLSLPAGRFIVNVTAVAYGILTAPDKVECPLYDSGSHLLGYGGAMLVTDKSGAGIGNIAITASTTTGGKLYFMCYDDTGEASMQDVSMTAIPVSTLR
jgi:hypothetical protein